MFPAVTNQSAGLARLELFAYLVVFGFTFVVTNRDTAIGTFSRRLGLVIICFMILTINTTKWLFTTLVAFLATERLKPLWMNITISMMVFIFWNYTFHVLYIINNNIIVCVRLRLVQQQILVFKWFCNFNSRLFNNANFYIIQFLESIYNLHIRIIIRLE
jgi:hypothetical protein